MDYDASITLLQGILTEHNKRLDPEDAEARVDVPATTRAVKRHGGTSVDGLAIMDAETFTACGFPPGCAKLAVKRLADGAEKASEAAPERVMGVSRAGIPGVVVLRSERDSLESESDSALLARYDHQNPGVIGEILDTRAGGCPFLVFTGDKLLAVLSCERLDLLRRQRPVTEFVSVDGRSVRPLRVGQPLKREAMKQNPLYDQPLQEPGEVCAVTKESYFGISQEIRGILEIAVERGELVIRDPETARAVIEKARRPDGLAKVRQHYAASAFAWDEMPERERPSGDYAPKAHRSARGEERRGFPFPDGGPGMRNG